MSRVYIVDDHALMRDGLRAVLVHGGHEVVGEGSQPAQVIAELVGLNPAIVLLDLNLAARSGFEILEQM